MSSLRAAYERVDAGHTVTLRPRGTSMRGLVEDRDEVCVAPVEAALLDCGDVVLARVSGRVYLHKVIAVEANRVRIGNNRGGVNGWTSRHLVAGIAVSVNGEARRGAAAKVRHEDDGDRERSPSSIS